MLHCTFHAHAHALHYTGDSLQSSAWYIHRVQYCTFIGGRGSFHTYFHSCIWSLHVFWHLKMIWETWFRMLIQNILPWSKVTIHNVQAITQNLCSHYMIIVAVSRLKLQGREPVWQEAPSEVQRAFHWQYSAWHFIVIYLRHRCVCPWQGGWGGTRWS